MGSWGIWGCTIDIHLNLEAPREDWWLLGRTAEATRMMANPTRCDGAGRIDWLTGRYTVQGMDGYLEEVRDNMDLQR